MMLYRRYNVRYKAKRHNPGGGKTNKNGKFHCHACNMDSPNLQEFDAHMRSDRHLQQLENMSTLLPQLTDRELQRMKAEEHIKRIEGKDLQDYCRICDKKFPNKFPGASFMAHRRSQEHRRKERLTKRGCKLCDTGSFHQYPEYVKHIDSEPHKKKKELLRKNNETCSSRSSVGGSSISGSLAGDDDTESNIDSMMGDPGADQDLLDGFPDNIDDMVTVDATGIYGEEDNEEASLECKSNRASPAARVLPAVPVSGVMGAEEEKPVSQEVEDNAPWKLKSETPEVQTAEPQAQCTIAQASKAPTVTVTISSNKHRTTSSTVSSSSVATSSSIVSTSSSTSSTYTELTELKPVKPTVKLIDPSSLMYDGESPVGVEQIVPVRGFFCKICLKFFYSEEAAKVTHCQSATHFEEYQKFLKKERNKAKLSSPVIPNGQYKQEPVPGTINNNNNSNSTSQKQKTLNNQYNAVNTNKHTQGYGGPKSQRINITSKASLVKDNTTVPINTDPLVCKNTPPVKRTIQVKPDHDIKVDINANSDIDEEKPKINGGLDLLNSLNNNDEDSVDNELSNGDDLLDFSLEDSDSVKNTNRGRSTRSSNRKIKTKKTRAK